MKVLHLEQNYFQNPELGPLSWAVLESAGLHRQQSNYQKVQETKRQSGLMEILTTTNRAQKITQAMTHSDHLYTSE